MDAHPSSHNQGFGVRAEPIKNCHYTLLPVNLVKEYPLRGAPGMGMSLVSPSPGAEVRFKLIALRQTPTGSAAGYCTNQYPSGTAAHNFCEIGKIPFAGGWNKNCKIKIFVQKGVRGNPPDLELCTIKLFAQQQCRLCQGMEVADE